MCDRSTGFITTKIYQRSRDRRIIMVIMGGGFFFEYVCTYDKVLGDVGHN